MITKIKKNLKKVLKRNSTKGFSLVELILSISIFGIVSVGLASGLMVSIQNSELSSYRSGAIFLAEEGLEASRSIRDIAYANLTDGNHGMLSSGSTWAYNSTSDVVGDYTRVVNISTVDANTKLITSTVSWPSFFSANNSVTITSYLTNWLRTVIIDFWTAPTLSNSVNLTAGDDGIKIAYINDYAYLIRTTTSPTLATINVNGVPTLTGSLAVSPASPVNIAVAPSGTYGAIASTSNTTEIQLLNFVNPAVPVVSASYNATGNENANSLFIDSSNRIYFVRALGAASNEFMILQVSTPIATPTLLGSANFADSMNDIFVLGNYAYIATSSNTQELAIYNISNPASPTLVGSYDKAGTTNCRGVSAYGTTALLGCDDNILYAINVTNPASPTLSSSVNVGATINDIDKNTGNTIAFLAVTTGVREFTTINITNPASISIRGQINMATTLFGVAYDSTRDKIYGAYADNANEFIRINEQ